MICGTHAMLAGAVGALSHSRSRAFLAGVGTHLIADLIPHRDCGFAVEAALVTAALAAVGGLAGFGSPAFAGALGGVAPDLEHALAVAGILAGSRFPSHQRVHGRPLREVVSQVVISAAALGVIAHAARSGKKRTPGASR